MKTTRQSIVKVLLLFTLAFGVNASANAQLGGLIDKAKKTAKSVVQNGVNNTVQQEVGNAQVDMVRSKDVEKKLKEMRKERAMTEKAAQDEAGQTGNLPIADEAKGDVDFFYFSGQRMGIYHPSTNSFDLFKLNTSNNKWITYTFKIEKDGKVTYDNYEVGKINSDGTMYSGQTKGISLDNQNFIYWNATRVGSISAFCEIYNFSTIMAYYYHPIDPKIAAFMYFCQTATDSSLKERLNNVKNAALTPGSLNAEYHDAALASIKRRFPNVLDVVITSNEWRIIRDNLGNIISRACDGWYIIPNGNGRRAISYCWKQSYLGGGQYDKLVESAANGFDPIDLD